MRKDTIRRFAGYGVGGGIVATLVWLALTSVVPPDADHYLLQAEIKLRYASCLLATDADGAPVPAREVLIRDAEGYLALAEELAKDSPQAIEYRGYIQYLRGDVRAAAASYRRASQLLAADAVDAQGELRVNEARMLVLAGDDAAALARLQAPGGIAGVARAAAGIETARILRRTGRVDAALAAARAAGELADSRNRAWVEAGELLEELGDDDNAASVYARVSPSEPLALYMAARLKARIGEFDKATEMLERAVEGMGPEVRRLVERDARVWQSVATTGRFQDLFPEAVNVSPGR